MSWAPTARMATKAGLVPWRLTQTASSAVGSGFESIGSLLKGKPITAVKQFAGGLGKLFSGVGRVLQGTSLTPGRNATNSLRDRNPKLQPGSA